MDMPAIVVAVVLALVGGGGGVKLIEFIFDRIKGSVAKRRAEVDRAAKLVTDMQTKLAAAELRSRLLTESLHDHRNQMLTTGEWTRDTLPPFLKE